jgi:hypothetical protein
MYNGICVIMWLYRICLNLFKTHEYTVIHRNVLCLIVADEKHGMVPNMNPAIYLTID